MAYQPIEDYGMIGNMRTVALIGKNGSIDWMCYPRFDAPSLFAGILDDEKGGRFQIAPVEEDYTSKQFYWPDTNVLITRFLTGKGVCEVTDFMPVGKTEIGEGENRLVRIIKMVRGHVPLQVYCRPAFDYARAEHDIVINEHGAAFHGPDLSIGLSTSVPLKQNGQSVHTRLELDEGESANFVIKETEEHGACRICYSDKVAEKGFRQTVNFWRNWLSHCSYSGRWRETVYRSALTLKMLTYEPTGAIVAAPTCSLPEHVGGERNWDYRYTWIRDAAFTLYAFMRIGFTEEAAKFMHFIENICEDPEHTGQLQIMYGIDGRWELDEEHLDHLEGYRGSSPVRIGNDAYDQLQLDIYGELMDSVYLFNKYGSPISYDFWNTLIRLVDWIGENWDRKDEGIWEVRGGKKHFTYSKLMSWVALDRGLRLADKRSFPVERDRWMSIRDNIYRTIMNKGWNEERQAFVQTYDSETLDASLLIMPLVFFVSPTDERMLKTIDAIDRTPDKGGLVSNSLVYRYNIEESPDGLRGEEGTFNICTFWMVEALTRAGRFDEKRLEDARLMFEQMLGYANHLGLYAEETGARGEALGNFPQAFTHLSLISAAFNLDRTLG